MATLLLATKLFIPALRPGVVPRPHLIQLANQTNAIPGSLVLVLDDCHLITAQAARLVEGLAENVWGRGEQITLSRWLEALPDKEVTSRPRLRAFHALVLLATGHFDAAERRLRAAERALGSITGETLTELQGMMAAVRALAAYFQGDVPAIIRFSRQALEALPEGDVTWRSSAATNLGDALSRRFCGFWRLACPFGG